MTTIRTFLWAEENDIFADIETGEEYTREQVDLGFQEFSAEPHITIKEYYEELIDYLKRFRKTKTQESQS